MPAIKFNDVSKKFILYRESPRSFQEMATSLFKPNHKRVEKELWALKDVSFTVGRGEAMGIIGSNGAGKSTLLKLASRILEPTKGEITIRGRVSALLELGAGFHPDLTGRENVYLNGSLLGLSRREIANKFDEIVSFAELERFIDIPIKYYSSGMQVRLGFAVATSFDPDVLLIDEVLAVGDQPFQKKCLARVNEMRGKGITTLFISHNLDAVRNLCEKAIWLDKGIVKAQGNVEEVIACYLENIAVAEGKKATVRKSKTSRGSRWGSGEAEITEVNFLDAEGNKRRTFKTGEKMIAQIKYRAYERIERPSFGIAIYRSDGVHINGPNTATSGYEIEYIEGEGEVRYTIERLPLLSGTYEFSATIYDYYSVHPYDHHHRMYTFTVHTGHLREREGVFYIPCEWEHLGGRSG
jgi:lipopolysaccharide transport system ATP-binding protein